MPKRKDGEGLLRLRSDGRWEGRVVIGYDEKGLPKTKNVLAKTKSECAEKLQALKEQCGRATNKIKPDMPFGEWIDFWYQNYCKLSIRPNTQMGYENNIYNHIIPDIGKIPLNKLTQNNLQQFYAKLKTSGRKQYTEKSGAGLSDRLVRSCHANCRTALEKAVSEGLIRANPSVDCKLPPKKAKEMQVLTQAEILRFLTQADAEGYYELFLLELTTGMRRGEILALKWSDLDERTGELHISRQVSRVGGKTIVSQPKTKSSIRTILLPTDMLDVLTAYKATANFEWMFPSSVNKGEPRNPSAVHHRFQKILERARCKNVRFHDLRHTLATMAIENGMDIKTLSAMIGHVSAATTLNTYSHITDTMKKQAALKIDREIGGTDVEINVRTDTNETDNLAVEEPFEPYRGKIRGRGTGCIYQVNEHLWEGSYSPRLSDGTRRKHNVYAKTREECEAKLAEMIERIKREGVVKHDMF